MGEQVATSFIQDWGAIGAMFIVLIGAIGILWRQFIGTNKQLLETLSKVVPALESNAAAFREQRTQLEKAIEHLEGKRQ